MAAPSGEVPCSEARFAPSDKTANKGSAAIPAEQVILLFYLT
jgi:hypothetical protein